MNFKSISPQGSNTVFSPELITQLLSQPIPTVRPAMPDVSGYCTKIFLPGPVTFGKTNFPIVSSVQAVQTNPTNFEQSNDVLALGETVLILYSAQFGFSNAEKNSGLELVMTLSSHLNAIESAVQAAINGAISESNFASATVTATSSAYTLANCESLLAAVPARTILALSPGYFVKTKSTWLPSGQENILKELSDLTAIGTNLVGFSARPEAIALTIGYPKPGPLGEVQTSMIRLQNGLEVQFSRWFQRGGRAWRASLDIALGVDVGQTAAMRLIKSS